ncbi:hypothetical protein V6N12_012534 [Hibiscus sabdariffa]|uniref:Transposase MuDR plant domain-containing protein n=1 Tax=Hibiscus sabdariffa TaxID=183260 RepID=A0ABR2B5F0_9ROSI
MSQDLESMFKGLPHVSNIGLRVSGVEELNVGGGSGSQRADSKRARRVDDDLGENEFDSSDLESLVDERNEDVDGVGEDDGNETDYLDSSDAGSYESDSDGEILFKKSSKVFFDTFSVEPRFEVGMIFESPQQFKEALYAYAVAQRFDFKFLKNEKERTRAKCKARGCPFRIYASFDKGDSCFKIKTFISEHECSITFKNKRANYLLVGKHFLSKIRIVPNLKLVEIKRLAKEELKVELHKHTCMKAKSWCLEQIRGRLGYEFSRLYDYVGALRDADPSCSFELKVERPTPFEIPKFRRLYVCFSTLKEAFRTYSRPVLSLDGCFLKGDFKGELLSVVGRDANNQIFPIAWAVVEVENRETWAWFLENLRIDLHLIDGEKFTVISDMQKGLLEEISLNLPKALNDVTEIEPITLNSYTQEQHTTETFNQATTTLVSQPPRTNVTVSREKTNVEIASSAIQIKKSPPIVLATKANQEPKKHLSIGPRGRTIMEGLGLYTNETTGLQILNPGSSSQILVSKPRNMKYSITRAHSPSVPFKSSSMASRPPTSTSLPPTTSSQPPTTVSLPLSTASSKQLPKQRSEIPKLAPRKNTPTIWRY